jgi:ABC-type uncharacterized transport system permease subunit
MYMYDEALILYHGFNTLYSSWGVKIVYMYLHTLRYVVILALNMNSLLR